MTAAELVALCAQEGITLVGRTVLTDMAGSYCGGKATILKLQPDPACPEIVYQVANPAYDDGEGGHEMGVFGYEDATLLPREDSK